MNARNIEGWEKKIEYNYPVDIFGPASREIEYTHSQLPYRFLFKINYDTVALHFFNNKTQLSKFKALLTILKQVTRVNWSEWGGITDNYFFRVETFGSSTKPEILKTELITIAEYEKYTLGI